MVTIFTNVIHMRTNWGLTLVLVGVFVSACGDVELKESAALTRGTDIQVVQPDAGAAPSPDADVIGTGGATGAGGAGSGGMTGTGGAVAGIGGATGAGGAPSYTCIDLLACCDSLTNVNQAQLKAQCFTVYNSAMTGTTSCGSALAMIKVTGLCP